MKPGQRLLQFGGALIVVLNLVVAMALPAEAAVTLAPSSGPPGTRVTASGSSTNTSTGASCKTVDVYFGATQHSDGHVVAKGTQVSSTNCDGGGRYSAQFTVPQNAPKGASQVLLEGKDSSGQTVSDESATFTVT